MRADARAKRAAILRTARQLIATQGGDVPLSLVAETAGVGIGTLYRHFPERPDLLEAVALDLREAILRLIEQHQMLMETSAEVAWGQFVHALAAERPGAIVSELVSRLDLDDRPDLVRFRATALEALDGLLDQARHHRLVDREVSATRFILGLAAITRSLPVVHPLPASAVAEMDGYQEWLVDVYLRGLCPSQTE